MRKCSVEIRHSSFNVALLGGVSGGGRRLHRRKGGRMASSMVPGVQTPMNISDVMDKHGEGVHLVCVWHIAPNTQWVRRCNVSFCCMG